MQKYISTLTLKRCRVCDLWYRNQDNHFKSSRHLINVFGYDPIVLIESAAKCRLQTFHLPNGQGHLDYLSFFEYCKPFVIDKIDEKVDEYKSIKCNIIVKSMYIKNSLETEKRELNFKTKNEPILMSTDLEVYYNDVYQKIVKEESNFMGRGSGWTLNEISSMELRINRYNPLQGRKHISLPPDIASKKAIINVQNTDNYCFKYSIYAKFITDGNAHRIGKYLNNEDMENRYNWNVISYPVTVKSIPKFEKANNISINVFGLEKNPKGNNHFVYPIKICKNEKTDHRDLLLLKNDTTMHYAYINNFERLICSQVTRHHGRIFICKSCLIHFTKKTVYDKHKILCDSHTPLKVEMPDLTESKLRFTNFKNKQSVPFVVYADFEAMLLKEIQCPVCNKATCENPKTCSLELKNIASKNKPSTVLQTKHVPMSFCYYIVNTLGLKYEPVVYRGPDAARVFVEKLKEEALKVKEIYDRKLPIQDLTAEQIDQFNSSTKCHICELEFYQDDIKVRDHCHLTGIFRGAAHNSCNLQFQSPNFLPVFMHNSSSYDIHFICQHLNIDNNDITVIPSTEEKYISLSKKVCPKFEIRYVDTFRFMSSSLDSLAKNLTKQQFKETISHFGIDKIDLVSKKGIFCYEYITDWNKLDEQSLPPIQQFYSSLTNSDITQQQYEHARNVWDTFNIQTIGSYSDLYLLTDVLILTDVFQNFRAVCSANYNLDPCWYYTAPGLSWDACLKMTNITLDLILDYEIYLMLEKGIRGGISQCTKRFSEAKNKYVETNITQDETFNGKSSFLMYFDVNNLYGHAMSQSMPYKDFEWCNNEEIKYLQDNILSTKKTDETGFILEVDLEYPSCLHDKHSDFPFCAEKKKPPKGKCEKLLTTLENKSNYIIHSQNLKQAIKNGLILSKIHRAIKFRQSNWLSKYIGKNTELRAAASNEFEKEFFKLMNNSFFGKTMENVRNRLNMQLVCNNTRRLTKLISKPNFIDRTIFSNDLVAIHLGKTKVKFCKPIYIGLSVLELSKKLMYKYHYKIFPKIFGSENLELNYMDTDSFVYNIMCDDVYEKIRQNLDVFDTSNYNKTHPCFSEICKKQVGKMKDEFGGIPLKKYLGLRSKLYSIMSVESVCTKRAKGVKRNVVENEITFHDYEAALFANMNQYRSMNLIKSQKHVLYTCNLNKLALSSFDDKRFILSDNIHTLPYGHIALRKDRKRKQVMHNELKVKRPRLN